MAYKVWMEIRKTRGKAKVAGLFHAQGKYGERFKVCFQESTEGVDMLSLVGLIVFDKED